MTRKDYELISKKRTVLQGVFDSPEARRIQREAHRLACADLERLPRHMLDKGNPNHPDYDLHIFGEHYESFMGRQYK